jgi:hypothetical protein
MYRIHLTHQIAASAVRYFSTYPFHRSYSSEDCAQPQEVWTAMPAKNGQRSLREEAVVFSGKEGLRLDNIVIDKLVWHVCEIPTTH